MELIDKAAVVAEIERLREIQPTNEFQPKEQNKIDWLAGKEFATITLQVFLDTLEVKEMGNIWHTISDRDVDLPKVGDIICFIKNGRIISGEYRLNKFYGKVNNGYDNPIEKGDKWCFLSDILNSVVEVKEVDLEKELNKEWNKCEPTDEGMGLEIASIEHEQFDNIAKHFFGLGIKAAQKGE